MANKDVPQEDLPKLCKNVETSYVYFRDNYQRFRDFKTYTFRETLNEQQKGMLTSLNRPQLEFNLGAAQVARKLGEFAEHEPSIIVSPSEGVPVSAEVIEIVEGNIRHKIHDANKSSFSYQIMKDMLGGGFSAAKIRTDFQSPMSFNQDIFWEKCFDATLVGFDPLARDPHKGDGQYSFELFPVLKEELQEQYPHLNISTKADSTYLESFQWCYKNMYDQEVILVADFDLKQKKRVRIVDLADGKVMTKKKYKEMQKYWEDENVLEQIPSIIKERTTVIDIIINYKFIRDQILERTETDHNYLSHVFFDGNSDVLAKGHSNSSYQFTKPYYYHCKGAQDMMNFMGIAITNSVDNMNNAKFIVMEEAIPQQQDYKDMITEPQRAGTIVVRAYSENNPDKPIPTPIREVQHPPMPPEVMGSFNQSISIIQAILGSGSSNPDNKQDYISGKAIIEATNVDNAAGMPYVVGYLAGIEQMARNHVDLTPKYILKKRTIPIVNKAGEQIFQDVNQPGKPQLNYEPGALKVNIDAGVNFQVQKDAALRSIIGLMQASPKFAEFMNSEQGLPILLDNLTIYSGDRLRDAADEWIEQQNKQQQQMMQMQQQAMQQDPRYIKAKADEAKVQIEAQKVQVQMQEVQQKAHAAEFDQHLEVAKLQIEKELADAKIMEAEANVNQAQIDSGIRMEELNTSHFNHAIDAATKIASIHHKQKMDEHESIRKSVDLHHKIKNEDKNDEKGESE